MRAGYTVVAVLALVLGLACGAPPPPGEPPPAELPQPAPPAQGFDAALAWAHVEALAAIGPRVMATPGAERARGYLRGELEALGLEIREQAVTARRADGQEVRQVHNLGAVIPGTSKDLFVLATAYDTRPAEDFVYLGVDSGASGAGVLLELARVLADRPLAFTTWVIFLEGEAPIAPVGTPGGPSYIGSRALAALLTERGDPDQIRLALVLERLCDPDLRIARDLRSHRVYREAFWDAAARLGHRDAFPPDAPFESPRGSHEALAAAGLRRVVMLADPSYGGDVPPGPRAESPDDDLAHCSERSLGIAGSVALAGLQAISDRLERIDRFAQSPVERSRELQLEDLEQRAEEEQEAPEAAPETPPETP